MNTQLVNKKVITTMAVALVLSIGSIFPSTLYAESETTYNSTSIPTDMAPSSIIKYVGDDEYVILEGDNASTDKKLVNKRALALSEPSLLPHEEYPTPEKGMIVQYGLDGEINDIKFPSENSEDSFTSLPTNQQELLDSYIDDMSEETMSNESISNNQDISTFAAAAALTPYATWGSAPNKMYIIDASRTRYGTGRATVFWDTIGQGDHKLKKGDIATKLKYDNCKLGLTVNVTMKKKGSDTRVTKQMKKWDAGGMPNAVVDIWKTGLNYWGYDFSKTWSKKGASIEHANKMI